MYVLYFLSFFSCCFVVLVLVLCFVHSFRRSFPPLPPSFWESLYPVFLIMWRMTGPFGRRRVHRLPRSQARGHFSLFLTVYKLFLFISQLFSIPVLLRITVHDCASRRVTTTRPGGLDYSHSFDDPHIVVFVSVHVDTSPPLLDAQYPVSNLIHRDCIAPFMLFAHPTSTQCHWILRYRRCDCHQASTHKSKFKSMPDRTFSSFKYSKTNDETCDEYLLYSPSTSLCLGFSSLISGLSQHFSPLSSSGLHRMAGLDNSLQ